VKGATTSQALESEFQQIRKNGACMSIKRALNMILWSARPSPSTRLPSAFILHDRLLILNPL